MTVRNAPRFLICDEEFGSFNDLAKHMKNLIDKCRGESNSVHRNDLIKRLKSIGECLKIDENNDIYEGTLVEPFQASCIELIKLCTRRDDIRMLLAILSCIKSIIDVSQQMCRKFIELGLVNLLINQMSRISERSFKSLLPNSITVNDIYYKLISIVHSIVKYRRYQPKFLENPNNLKEFKELIKPFMNSKDAHTCILTIETLAYLIEDEIDESQLGLYDEIIDNCVQRIRRGIRDKNRCCDGIQVVKLLKVLKILSNIQSLKYHMNQVPLVNDLTHRISKSKDSTPEEKTLSLKISFNLKSNNLVRKKESSDLADLVDPRDIILNDPNNSNTPLDGGYLRMKEIDNFILTEDTSIATENERQSENERPTRVERNLKEWTTDDVSDWARRNNLSEALSNLSKVDGSTLLYFKKMKRSSPSQYYRRLRDLNLSLAAEKEFDNALDKLN